MTLKEYIIDLEKLITKEKPSGEFMQGYFDALKDVAEELKGLKEVKDE